MSSHFERSRSFASMCRYFSTSVSTPSFANTSGTSYTEATSLAVMTASSCTLQKSAIFDLSSFARKRSVRQSKHQGRIPMLSSSFTECCVGLVLICAAARHRHQRHVDERSSRPSSCRICRIASMNGSDSMSPTVTSNRPCPGTGYQVRDGYRTGSQKIMGGHRCPNLQRARSRSGCSYQQARGRWRAARPVGTISRR